MGEILALSWIKSKVFIDEYEYSSHADEEREAEKILLDGVEQAILNGEVLEKYPDDARGESCLVLGYGNDNCPIHIVC